MAKPLRVLIVSAHPVQYAAPLYRVYAQDPRLDLTVAYCSLQGAEPGVDPEFGIEVAWDLPLLAGYRWVHPRSRSPRPGLRGFLGLLNPGLWTIVRRGRFDAVVLHLGYRCASFWISLAAAKLDGAPVLFGTDAQDLRSRNEARWRAQLKRLLWPSLFRLADVVLVLSTGGVDLMKRLGLPEERVALTSYVVDNDWWRFRVAGVDRTDVRRRWDVPDEAAVVLFVGKLQPWKRPQDLLRAFVAADQPEVHLVVVGEGPLRAPLMKLASDLRVADRVRFQGFVNQSGLPEVYAGADLLVVPSSHEPFGLVVNEAMLCGLPVIVSDRVGARHDLIREGTTGLVYPCGDVHALAALLQATLGDRKCLAHMAEAALARMQAWSPRTNLASFVEAVRRASNGHQWR